MICLICRQFEIVDGPTSVRFQRGEINIVINNVPARVCPSCREAYVDEEIAVKLLREAAEMSEAGMLDAHSEYNAV